MYDVLEPLYTSVPNDHRLAVIQELIYRLLNFILCFLTNSWDPDISKRHGSTTPHNLNYTSGRIIPFWHFHPLLFLSITIARRQ